MSFNRILITLGAGLALCVSAQFAVAENAQPFNATTDTTAHATPSATNKQKVNINSATIEQLEAVKGIGPSKAKAIVEYRTEHGPFKSVDNLDQIKGFSPKVLTNLNQKNPGVLVAE